MYDKDINFQSFNPQLENLKGTVLREIQSPRSILSTVTQLFTVAAFCDYTACRALCADTARQRFPGQAELINRATLEGVFNFFFIADSPKEHWDWYVADGWEDQKKLNQRYQTAYATAPELQVPLAVRDRAEKKMAAYYGLGGKGSKGFWPTPGRMLRDARKPNPYGLSTDAYSFLAYLYDWMYPQYSQNAHSRFNYIPLRCAPSLVELRTVLRGEVAQLTDCTLRKAASITIYRGSLFLLMMCSEAVIRFKLNLQRKSAQYIWKVLREFREADEVYQHRYQNLLG